MHRIGQRSAGGMPLGDEIAHHAYQLRVAPFIQSDDGLDRHAAEDAFDDHLVEGRVVEIVGGVGIMAGNRLEWRLHR